MVIAILVQAEDGRTVRLSEPDEDGDYGWNCQACLADEGDTEYQPIGDAIQHAEAHLAFRCPEQRSTT